MRNNSVNLFQIWASGSGGDVVKKILIWISAALLFTRAEPFMQFLKRASCEVI